MPPVKLLGATQPHTSSVFDDPVNTATHAPSSSTAKPAPGSDWWATLQQHPQFNNIMGSLLGVGAAGLGSHLLSSKDDREEQSGFSQMLPWLLGGGAGYYFGPELMKMLAGAGKTAPASPGTPPPVSAPVPPAPR